MPAPAQGKAISVVCFSSFLSFDSWIFDIFQIPDSILPYYGHSGKGLNKTADYSCKTARFSMRKLSSAFPVAPPMAAHFVPSCAILQSPNFIKKVRKTLFFIFPAVPYQAGKKRTATQLLKPVRPYLLLDDFHAPGGHIKKISEVRRSPPMRN